MSSIRTLSNGGTNTNAKMKRQEKAEKIGFILNELYPTTPIPLDHDSAYTLTVAVMLSAQTTDKKVNQVTPALFRRANTPEKMARLDVSEIQSIIKEIGLAPTKAKNLKKMAEQILNNGGYKRRLGVLGKPSWSWTQDRQCHNVTMVWASCIPSRHPYT